MAFQFRNTGAAITDALFNFMREKEKARREAMQDRLERDREARLGRSTDAQIENMRADTELAREQLTATLADRDVQRRTREAELAGETYDIGDDVTEDPAVPKNMRNKQRTLASRTLDMSTGVPGVIDAPMMQGRDMGTSETGRETFRGTADQRAAAAKKAEEDTELAQWKQRMDALQKDPNTPAAVKQWAQFAEPGDTPPAGVFDTAADAPKVGSFEDYVVRKYGANPSAQQIASAREEYRLDPVVQPNIYVNPAGFGPGLIDRTTGAFKPAVGADGNPLNQVNGGEWRAVVSRVVDGLPSNRRAQKVNTFNYLLEQGDTAELADQIRQTAIDSENVDLKNQLQNRINMRAALGNIGNVLNQMEREGVPTNILSGTVEDVMRKLGATSNPRYAELANQLRDTVITYRRAATGVAFSEKEQADYERMFPNYRNLPEVNQALIKGMLDSIDVIDNAYWTHKLGPQGAALVMGGGVSTGAPTGTPARPTGPLTPEQQERARQLYDSLAR